MEGNLCGSDIASMLDLLFYHLIPHVFSIFNETTRPKKEEGAYYILIIIYVRYSLSLPWNILKMKALSRVKMDNICSQLG